jgi:hypothetical protein
MNEKENKMRIKLQNRYVALLVPFLQGMGLKGEQSRARSKFLLLATGAYASLHESELELLREFAVCDGNGEPQMAEDGSFSLKDGNAAGYLAERDRLFSEVAEIEGGTYTTHLEVMRQVLADYDGELSGDEAALYDALMDAFEEEDADAGE